MNKRYLFPLSLLLFGCSEQKSMQDYLNSETFDMIIDVRTPEEYISGHVDGAINVALDIIDQYNGNKNDHIALYCRSGNRSGQAKQILESLGYQHVTNIGGVIDKSVQLVK